MQNPSAKYTVPSPACRGLCVQCGQYNWVYHLTRHLPGSKKHAWVRREDRTVEQAISTQTPAFLGKIGHGQEMDFYGVSSMPYGGVYYVNEEYKRTRFDIGPLRNLMSSSSSQCSFCNILIRAARKEGLVLPPETYVMCEFADPRIDMNSDPAVLIIRVQEPKWKEKYKYGLQMTLLGNEETTAFGRPSMNPFQIDVRLLRKWRDRCASEHPMSCQPLLEDPFGTERGPTVKSFKFRVIDVYTNQVVLAPPKCKYIALSYVWGGVVPYRLRRAELIIPTSGFPPSKGPYAVLQRQQLPRTIQDAMYVVELLEERYLWVDCLCIVQDDIDELKGNIHSMHRIFSAAQLTIIAASGADANTGLPGLHLGTRQIDTLVGSIENIGVAESDPNLSLGKTAWASRGWTYQEYQFSPRALVFTTQRLYFECVRGTYGEVRPDRLCPMPGKTQLFDYTRSTCDIGPFGKYTSHVRDYSSRMLTYENDVLNAFSAIMEDYAGMHDTTFCWGLPLKQFILAFMWVNGRYCDDITKKLRRRGQGNSEYFPSWSWAGWVGQVDFDLHDNLAFVENVTSAVTWPWDTEYNISMSSDPFVTGVLTIQVELAVIDMSQPMHPEERKRCRFDDGEEHLERVEGFLLGNIGNQVKQYGRWKRGTAENILNNHIVIAVKRDGDGLYHRIGLMRITEQRWYASGSAPRIIELG